MTLCGVAAFDGLRAVPIGARHGPESRGISSQGGHHHGILPRESTALQHDPLWDSDLLGSKQDLVFSVQCAMIAHIG